MTGQPRFTATLAASTINGRPVGPYMLRALQRAFAAGGQRAGLAAADKAMRAEIQKYRAWRKRMHTEYHRRLRGRR